MRIGIFACPSLILLAGCQPTTAPGGDGERRPAAVVALEAIARSMADIAVREALHDALRSSPFSEHKLVLQEALQADLGDRMRVALASHPGAWETLSAAVHSLPNLQVYAPRAEQRTSWTYEEPVIIVGAKLGHPAPLIAFDQDGRQLDVNQMPESLPGLLLLVEPVEPMYTRLLPRSVRPSLRIQPAGESQIGIGVRITDFLGRVIRAVDIGARQNTIGTTCSPENIAECMGDVGGGGVGSTAGTYLTALNNNGVCDDLLCAGSLEIEFRSVSMNNPALVLTQITGIEAGFSLWTGSFFATTYRAINQWVNIAVWETDGWPNGDDGFYCQLGTGCFVPQLAYVPPGASRTFHLCEDGPNCTYSAFDIVFQDRP